MSRRSSRCFILDGPTVADKVAIRRELHIFTSSRLSCEAYSHFTVGAPCIEEILCASQRVSDCDRSAENTLISFSVERRGTISPSIIDVLHEMREPWSTGCLHFRIADVSAEKPNLKKVVFSVSITVSLI